MWSIMATGNFGYEILKLAKSFLTFDPCDIDSTVLVNECARLFMRTEFLSLRGVVGL